VASAQGISSEAEQDVALLRLAKTWLDNLAPLCPERDIVKLPMVLGMSDHTVPKLLDEYNWVTMTKRCYPLPNTETFQQWSKGNSVLWPWTRERARN
jgi:hypothetical protein